MADIKKKYNYLIIINLYDQVKYNFSQSELIWVPKESFSVWMKG